MTKIKVDPSFAGSGKAARQRRRKRLLRRVATLGALGAVPAAVVLAIVALWPFGGGDEPAPFDDDNVLVQSEETAETGITLSIAAAEAFLDIRGEPMIITLPDGPVAGVNSVTLSAPLDAERAQRGKQVVLIDDTLLDATQQVQLTMPSSSSDLAAFQARREAAIAPPTAANDPPTGAVSAGSSVTVDDDAGSWGEIVGTQDTALRTVSYVETVIEDTTTQVVSLASAERDPLYRDALVRVEEAEPLADILSAHDISAEEVDRIMSYVARYAGRTGITAETLTTLQPGGLVALRRMPGRFDAQLLHLSLYSADAYLTTIAQTGPGRFETTADPWFAQNLRNRADRAVRARGADGEIRLKDAIYSTALRNGVPPELVGELMVMLSRVQDLDRIALQDDRLRLLITEKAQGFAPAGRILYAEVTSRASSFECYVVKAAQPTAPFGCYDANQNRGGGVGLGHGFIVPVAGTKTSNFGPRRHPILLRTVNHNGVDWAAPIGTPVYAAGAGQISRADVSPSYGNIVYIDHANKAQTRYAHLDGFAPGIANGTQVRQGELIGYVGTTGRSTGPHLHFEMLINGRPVNPLAVSRTAGSSASVTALVNQIIRVESAGNARAQNSRSTATGLGQFIDSTWLRMISTYRPDLAASLTRDDLLDLRFDPELSRAMVANLARENEAFLQTRGHQVTPGRLYLAHFLGPAGAHVALNADPQAQVADTMGASVVNANPFLRDRTVLWMTNWADRKMRNVTADTAPAAPQPLPAEVAAYQERITGFLASL
ncbi:peptidase M23-like protein [Yoonia maricola]|uniref:Peptidase M23-like protein n=1 Tax=Yoonia maricola TaxID=420999 RepID=A0A2M8W004_9RHOB|nr:M23 family metallopeptidase [Yoonia maricola]PJI84239.1 peptidase M23-like protein [Yoonia maricola]